MGTVLEEKVDAKEDAKPLSIVESDPSKCPLIEALIKAQLEFPVVTRDEKATVETKKGGRYSYTYTSLAELNNAVDPALHKHGLTVIQEVDVVNDQPILRTTLWHISGQNMGSIHVLKPPVNDYNPDHQSMGMVITYFRRYAKMALLGVASEDDDGNAASGHSRSKGDGKVENPPESKKNDNGEKSASGSKNREQTKDERKAFAISRNLQMPDDELKTKACAIAKVDSRTKIPAETWKTLADGLQSIWDTLAGTAWSANIIEKEYDYENEEHKTKMALFVEFVLTLKYAGDSWAKRKKYFDALRTSDDALHELYVQYSQWAIAESL
jgi:hypothetical protein